MVATQTLTTILTPNGILGYGYELSHFYHAINNHDVKAIIFDAGSTDPGPSLLGSGETLCSRSSITRDLVPVLRAAHDRKIKVLLGSVGGAGLNSQVDDMIDIMTEICQKNNFPLKIAAIYSDIKKDLVTQRFKANLVEPCGLGPPPLTQADIDDSSNIVAQIGAEPFLELLKDDSIDVFISGRAYDPAPFAAYAQHHGMDVGPSWHMGKILECGALCALPKGKTIVAKVQKDNFILTPISPYERCTPLSVCAHTTYEKTRPDLLAGPGGILDLNHAKYEQMDDERSVRVSNAIFTPSPRYQVKLEGAAQAGFRTIFIGGIRDPTLIAGIDDFLEKVQKQTTEGCAPELASDSDNYKLIFHVYGKNAVMGHLDPVKSTAHEIGVMGEILAPNQDKANSIAGFARVCVLHAAYPGQLATGGNLALPLTPLQSPIGAVFKFSIYHLMDVDGEQASLFPTKVVDIGPNKQVNGHANGTNGTSDPSANVPKLEAVDLPPLSLKTDVPSGPCKLKDVAKIIRSKNSGPFQITLDVLFDDEALFDRVQKANVLTDDVLCKAYQLKSKNLICANMFFRPALAWKFTFVRPWAQGSIGERDTFGTQQHAPLLDIDVPAAQQSSQGFQGEDA